MGFNPYKLLTMKPSDIIDAQGKLLKKTVKLTKAKKGGQLKMKKAKTGGQLHGKDLKKVYMMKMKKN